MFIYCKSLGRCNGLCLPPFIFLREEHKGFMNEFRIHELIHWKQYKEYGFLMYYVRYAMQFVFIGYDLMPMECEARKYQEKTSFLYKNYSLKKHKKK